MEEFAEPMEVLFRQVRDQDGVETAVLLLRRRKCEFKLAAKILKEQGYMPVFINLLGFKALLFCEEPKRQANVAYLQAVVQFSIASGHGSQSEAADQARRQMEASRAADATPTGSHFVVWANPVPGWLRKIGLT